MLDSAVARNRIAPPIPGAGLCLIARSDLIL